MKSESTREQPVVADLRVILVCNELIKSGHVRGDTLITDKLRVFNLAIFKNLYFNAPSHKRDGDHHRVRPVPAQRVVDSCPVERRKQFVKGVGQERVLVR